MHNHQPIHTFQIIQHPIIALLSLTIVLGSCNKGIRHHRSRHHPTHNIMPPSSAPISLSLALIDNIRNKFGYIGLGTCYEECLDIFWTTWHKDPGALKDLFTSYGNHNYLKKVCSHFIPMDNTIQNKIDSNLFVIYQYILCTDAIQNALFSRHTNKEQKVDKIEQAIAQFKTATQQVRPGAGGKQLSGTDDNAAIYEKTCFNNAHGEEGYTLSNHFDEKLVALYRALDKKFIQTKVSIAAYNPSTHDHPGTRIDEED